MRRISLDGLMRSLSGLLGCTEGQAYTIVIGLILAVALALIGIPPTIR